ncbi:tape measure protein [uncultured Desulfuromusa sp.]|uniref:tape measure protein n=1 Tax=uncultured Desulfuromusa sp. TaxID=219183 RepID=UPI002AA7533D|nr:tape measure protein [uncultured Desulfuromusa sp.]
MNDLKLKLILEAIDKASPDLKKVKGGVDQVDSSAKTATSGARSLSAAIGPAGLAAAAGATAVVLVKLGKDILEAGMKWEALDGIMDAATVSQQQSSIEMEFTRQQANRLGLDLETVAGGYAKLNAASRGTNITQKEVRETWLGIVEAGTVLRLSAADQAGAMRAVEQIMSKGNVQAEELRGQLGERIPGAFQIAARAMGVTTQELNKMLEQGQVLSDDFLPKFGRQLRKEFGEQLPEATTKLRAELNRLSTEWFELQVDLADGAGMETAAELTRDLTGFVRTLHQGLKDLDSFLDDTDIGDNLAGIFKNSIANASTMTMTINGLLVALEKYQNRDRSGEKIKIEGADTFRDRSNKRELDLALSQNTFRPTGSSDPAKTSWTKKELDAYTKLGKDITDSWQQMYNDRNEIQSRSLDVQIQMEKEAAELSKISWEASKDFWQIQAEDKFEVLSRSTEAMIALDKSWQTSLMNSLDELADYYDETFGDRLTGTVFNAFGSMEDAMVEFALTGKTSFKDMINSILSDIMRLAIQQNITGPLASALNAGLSGLLSGTTYTMGSQPSAAFGPALHNGGKVVPRFHSGGLANDEIPAILLKGETVLDREHTRKFDAIAAALEGRTGGASNVIINNYGDATNASVSQQQNSQGGTDIIVTLEKELASRILSRRGKLGRSIESMLGVSRIGGR